jgi:hypothetical protein
VNFYSPAPRVSTGIIAGACGEFRMTRVVPIRTRGLSDRYPGDGGAVLMPGFAKFSIVLLVKPGWVFDRSNVARATSEFRSWCRISSQQNGQCVRFK